MEITDTLFKFVKEEQVGKEFPRLGTIRESESEGLESPEKQIDTNTIDSIPP